MTRLLPILFCFLLGGCLFIEEQELTEFAENGTQIKFNPVFMSPTKWRVIGSARVDARGDIESEHGYVSYTYYDFNKTTAFFNCAVAQSVTFDPNRTPESYNFLLKFVFDGTKVTTKDSVVSELNIRHKLDGGILTVEAQGPSHLELTCRLDMVQRWKRKPKE